MSSQINVHLEIRALNRVFTAEKNKISSFSPENVDHLIIFAEKNFRHHTKISKFFLVRYVQMLVTLLFQLFNCHSF